MVKKIVTTVLLLIHFLFLQGVYGQTSANFKDNLSEKFLRFCKTVPREEIFIHSDREEYISGEDMWFNLYLIDRQSFKPSTGSKIAYFELLNPENRPIVQKKVWLDGGFGPGQIALPDTLSTGTYTIRAYTSWMKNFLPNNCFTKVVHIYNAFSNKTFKRNLKLDNINRQGLSTKISPELQNTGLTVNADNFKPDFLEIIVSADEKYRSENSNQFYLFIQTHGIINIVSTERISGEITKISIPKSQLSSGINRITVFNLKGQPVGERYIYTPDKVNPGISIHSVDSSGLRKKISLDLEFGKGLSSSLNSTNFSISVAPETINHDIMDINDYMVFGTEFGSLPPGVFKNRKINEITPELIDNFLQTVKSDWINWNIILSDQPPVFRYQMENEDHYLSGRLTTSGQNSEDSDKYVICSSPGKTAAFQYAKADKAGKFSFKLHIDEKIKDLIIQPDIVTKNQSLNIESPFSDQYLRSEISVDSLSNQIPDYISTWSVNHQVRKIYGTSYIGDPISPVITLPNIKRFYGKPDQELIMKDYIILPVMQEVFFELLVGVFLKSKKSGYEITVANPENNKAYETPPRLFIDGVMVKDPSLIASLDPEIVERIDVVRNKYYVGDFLFFGIVNIITKAADFSNATLPDYAIRLHYSAIDPTGSFVSPDYSSAERKKSRIPDFRNTLYWNPSVKPDKDGKARVEFWTSDFASDFEVNVQGITPEGKMYSIKKIIKVKR